MRWIKIRQSNQEDTLGIIELLHIHSNKSLAVMKNTFLKSILILSVMLLTLSCAKRDMCIVFDGPRTVSHEAQTVISNAREDLHRGHSKEFSIQFVVGYAEEGQGIIEYDAANDCYSNAWVTVRKKGNGIIFEFTENTSSKVRTVNVECLPHDSYFKLASETIKQLPKEE